MLLNVDGSRRGRRVVLVHHRDADHRVRHERRPPGQQLEEDDAERVDVAARVDPAAVELLGRHVGRRADDHPGSRERGRVHAGGARDPEIEEVDRSVARDHDVARLHVAVHDAGEMRGRQRVGHGRGEPGGVGGRPRAAPRNLGPEIVAVDELRHEEHLLAVDAPVEDAQHGRVVDLREDADLALEALDAVGSSGESRMIFSARSVPVTVSRT
jgi:hypothetical protein